MLNGILRTGRYSDSGNTDDIADAAATQTALLSEPLIPNNKRSVSFIDHDASDEEDEEREAETTVYSEDILLESFSRKDITATTLAVSLLVTAGLAASAFAMISVPSAIVILMGGICIVNSPMVAQKYLSIAKNAGVRTSVNNIRTEIDLLRTEIEFAAQALDDLQSEADAMAGLEQELQTIAKKQGTNAKHIIDMVNENELILNGMNGNLRQTFAAAMATIIIRSDTAGDMKIDLEELPLLSLRLQIQLEPYGIKLDASKFKAMIKEDNDISNVLKFCADVLFKGDSNDNDDDDSSVDSELTFDFESFCRTIVDEGETKMTHDEKADMVTVEEKYSRGSVEVARGKRMTLIRSKGKTDLRRKTIVNEVKRRQTKLAGHLASRNSSGHHNSSFSFASGLVIIRGTNAELL